MKHVIRPAAKDDIIRQYRYYLLKDAFDAGTRFLDAVDASIKGICTSPYGGTPKPLRNPVLSGLRSCTVNGFGDILIFNIVQSDALRIIRILHGRRDIRRIFEREKNDESSY